MTRAIFPHEDEEPLKRDFFRGTTKGYFVEVGANDPKITSQTFELESLGWTGVLIEPQPPLAHKLRQHRRARVFAVACASRESSGKTLTLNLAGGHSSLDPHFYVAGQQRVGTIEVPVRTLDDILVEAEAPSPIDFVSIDVEGYEKEVLAGFDLDRWRPRLILIEDHALNLRLHKLLRARGYKWIRRTGVNGWYVPAESNLDVGAFGRWQFFRKYYLGLPFRHARDAKRRLRDLILAKLR
jgi:FkbM family methyltransferase